MANTRPHAVDPSTATARALLVYKTTDYDSPSHVGLGVVAACTAKTLRANGIWAEAWGCTDSANLRARLERACAVALQRGQIQPTHVIVHAPWVPTCELAALARDFPDIVFAVVSHSNFGFLAADPNAVQLLREAVELQHSLHNVVVAGNSEKFARAASVIWNTNVAFLPNLYDLSEPMLPARPAWSGDSLRLGLFGACRLLKNGLTAAAAAASLSATLRVPTQLYVSEKNQAMAELCENAPGLTLVVTGWMPWAKFRQLVGSMHLLLQPSFTESFNVVTADGVHQGVPSVVSDAIDWTPARWRANPDDAEDLVRVAQYLLKTPQAVDDGRTALTSYVTQGLQTWKAFLAASAG
ncbi:MAG: hypothetical protein ACRELB_21125 [Polyangiaceae bacterium]